MHLGIAMNNNRKKTGGKKHSFDVDIAALVGERAAVLFNNLQHWCEWSEGNNCHFHDDNYWTFNSISSFKKIYPYMTENKIRSALDKLEKANLVITGNYNKMPYDRTKWYAITEKGNMLTRYGISHLCETTNGFGQNHRPIPNINNNINKKTIGEVAPQHSPTEIENQELTKIANRVISRLNKITGKKRRLIQSNRKHIIARLKDGYTYQDFIKVIKTKKQDPHFIENPHFLRPSTLFTPSHFEDYLNEDPSSYKTKPKSNNKNRYRSSDPEKQWGNKQAKKMKINLNGENDES